MSAEDMPCGRCDVGMYSYAAALTPLAHKLVAEPRASRTAPQCKSFDRPCVGACHFIEAINDDPAGWVAIKAEALAAAALGEKQHG